MSAGMGACLSPRQAGVHWMGRQCHPQSPDICYGSPPVFWELGTSKPCAFLLQMSSGLGPHAGDQSGQLFTGGLLVWDYPPLLPVDR